MKVIGINGSPRKAWNTALMLENALKGAAQKGAETKMINLYDLNYTGCKSCFACKRLEGPSFGRCAANDDLKAVLEEIITADALIIATPIYFGDVTGQIRSFLERLYFPSLLYSADGKVSYDLHLNIGLIYTTGNPVPDFYKDIIERDKGTLSTFVGQVKGVVQANDTLQFDDYSKYASSMFSEEAKLAHRAECFEADLLAAKELGASLV